MLNFNKDPERIMQAKKREILQELEDAKERVLKELSDVNIETLTRFRELLKDYNKIAANTEGMAKIQLEKINTEFDAIKETYTRMLHDIAEAEKILTDYNKFYDEIDNLNIEAALLNQNASQMRDNIDDLYIKLFNEKSKFKLFTYKMSDYGFGTEEDSITVPANSGAPVVTGVKVTDLWSDATLDNVHVLSVGMYYYTDPDDPDRIVDSLSGITFQGNRLGVRFNNLTGISIRIFNDLDSDVSIGKNIVFKILFYKE